MAQRAIVRRLLQTVIEVWQKNKERDALRRPSLQSERVCFRGHVKLPVLELEPGAESEVRREPEDQARTVERIWDCWYSGDAAVE